MAVNHWGRQKEKSRINQAECSLSVCSTTLPLKRALDRRKIRRKKKQRFELRQLHSQVPVTTALVSESEAPAGLDAEVNTLAGCSATLTSWKDSDFILRRTPELNRKAMGRMAHRASLLPLNVLHLYISGTMRAEKFLSKS